MKKIDNIIADLYVIENQHITYEINSHGTVIEVSLYDNGKVKTYDIRKSNLTRTKFLNKMDSVFLKLTKTNTTKG